MTKTKKATTKIATKKRIKVSIVGSKSVTKSQAIDSAEHILSRLLTKYDITRVVTVKEDLLGREVRSVAKRLGLKTKTYSAADNADQSNSLELATASLIWAAKRFIVVVGNGRIEGCARYAMEMLSRMKRKAEILELKD